MYIRTRIKKKYRQIFQHLRILHYSFLSVRKHDFPKCRISQPLLLLGQGVVTIRENVTLGFFPSPGFFSGYQHIEARTLDSSIEIGENTIINNSATIIADKAHIYIGKSVLIGQNFTALSSNFHPINSKNRLSKDYTGKNIMIDDNVFIGANVTVLQGVRIGINSVIGANSLVNINIPANSIALGNPIQVIKMINFN